MTPDSTHIIMSISHIEDAEILADADRLQELFERIADESGLTRLQSMFNKFPDGELVEGGVSGVVVITESHLSIHTWPKDRYAAVDVFTCGKPEKAYKAAKLVAEYLGGRILQVVIDRGEDYLRVKNLE